MPSKRLTITVKRVGPYVIELEDAANVRILDHEGRELVPEPGRPIKLCRCGASAIKPFCDASHKRIGFLCDPVSSDAVAPGGPGSSNEPKPS